MVANMVKKISKRILCKEDLKFVESWSPAIGLRAAKKNKCSYRTARRAWDEIQEEQLMETKKVRSERKRIRLLIFLYYYLEKCCLVRPGSEDSYLMELETVRLQVERDRRLYGLDERGKVIPE